MKQREENPREITNVMSTDRRDRLSNINRQICGAGTKESFLFSFFFFFTNATCLRCDL